MREGTAGGRIVVVTGPSGAGKSTITRELLRCCRQLDFSVSATTRSPRPGERNGVNYHFVSKEEFERLIKDGEFVEWEEVFPGVYYGTLRSELERIWRAGKHALLDIDIKGALRIKEQFGNRAIVIFILPEEKQELHRRLLKRGTEQQKEIDQRLQRAEMELTLASRADYTVINQQLEKAVNAILTILSRELGVECG